MSLKRIIWDFNGTLLDDLSVCFECVNTLLVRHGVQPFADYDKYRHTFRFPIKEYYRDAGFDFDKTPYDVLAAEFMELYYEREPYAPLVDGVKETLDTLRSLGIKQTVLSASRLSYLRTQIDRLGITHYFDEVLGISDIYAASKLHIARNWISASNEDPDTMLMIGDTLHDAETASELGCRCVLYSGGHQSLDTFDGPVIDSISEVLNFFH